MITKIMTWDKVAFDTKHGRADYGYGYSKFAVSKDKDHAIRMFCDWLNQGALNSQYYAKKDENYEIINIYEKSFDDEIPDKLRNVFFGFEFYDTGLEYNNKPCPAFTDINTDYLKLPTKNKGRK